MQYVCTELYLDVATDRHICVAWTALNTDLLSVENVSMLVLALIVLWGFKRMIDIILKSMGF